jgi:hypothetical protein
MNTLWIWGSLSVILIGIVTALVWKLWPRRPDDTPALKPYSNREDLKRDLADPLVPIDTILARCGGQLPADLDQEVTEIVDRCGGRLPANLDQEEEKEDRPEIRQAWFKKLAGKLPMLKVVPPPTPQAVVLTIKTFAVPCQCRSMLGRTAEPFHERPCRRCKGRGYVFIQYGGK